MDSKQRIVLLSEELATVELNNAIVEETGINDEIHRVMQAATALESVMYLMNDPASEIPVTPTPREMSLAAIAVDQAGALMEVPVGDIVASMEAYSGGDARVIMEDLKERLEKIWAALVEMMQKLWQYLKDLIGDLVTTTGALDKRADRIIQAVKDGKATSSGTAPVKDEALRKRLYSPNTNGKAIDAEYRKYAEAIELAIKAADVLFREPKMQDVFKDLREKKSPEDAREQDTQIDKLLEICESTAKTMFDKREGDAAEAGIKAAEGCKLYSSPLFIGNIGYYMQCPTESKNIRQLRFSRYAGDEGTLGDLRELNEKQIAICMTTWKIVKGLNDLYKTMEKTLQKNLLVMKTLNFTAGEGKAVPQRNLIIARAFITLCSIATLYSPSHLVRVSRDVFRLCEHSLDLSEAGAS